MYRIGDIPGVYSPDWLRSELLKIQSEMGGAQPFAYLQTQHKPIEKPRNGMIVLADGFDWNPGSGAGYYGYQAGAWTKL